MTTDREGYIRTAVLYYSVIALELTCTNKRRPKQVSDKTVKVALGFQCRYLGIKLCTDRQRVVVP
jgi:hypothetical protein